jgi:hypothetical protein
MPFRAVAYQETLEQGGVPENQARAHAKAIEEYVVSETITKEYFEATLDAKLFALQIDAKLAALKYEILKWVVGSVGAATVTILVALFRFTKP